MADLRAAILNSVYEADRLHKQFDSKVTADQGDGRIDVFQMLVKRDIPTLFRPLKGLLGAFLDNPSPGVLITTQRQLPIQRFTAAHELGHAVLGHRTSYDDESILAQMPFLDRKRYDLQEMQANAFASELLMPQWLLARHMLRQEWKADDLNRPEIVYQLSLRLGTSYSATCHTLVYKKIIARRAYEVLLNTKPRTIKQRLAEPFQPDNWYGDIWVITERDDGMFIEGSRSDLVMLKFKEHSGSGYLWRLDELADVGLAVVRDGRVASHDEDVVGGVVVREVITQAQLGAKGRVNFQETRPWQTSEEPLHSLDFDVDLSGPVSSGLLPAQREALLGAA